METAGRLWAACHDYTAHSGSTGSLSPGEGSRCYLNCGTQETMKALQLLKNSAQKMPFPALTQPCRLSSGQASSSLMWFVTSERKCDTDVCRAACKSLSEIQRIKLVINHRRVNYLDLVCPFWLDSVCEDIKHYGHN